MGYYNLISLMSPKGPSFDPDAQLFITNAAITEPVQQNAINNLVIDLKNYGVWTKMKALYPFVGGTASQHKFNLKNPLDTDAAFRLVFNGGWTHSSTGALPNGTNAFADTKLIPSVSLTNNNYHLSNYSRTQITSTNSIDIGCSESDGRMIGLSQWYNLSYLQKVFLAGNYGSAFVSVNNTDTLGLQVGTRTSQTLAKMFMDGTQTGASYITSNPSGLPVRNMYISATNSGGAGASIEFSPRQLAFSSIGDGLTDTEAANYYTAVQTFQTTLNRQVGVPIVADSDAQAFLNAAVITDTTQASAVNTLVTDLKGYGIWTKMKALYPFVGGTAAQHKFNLRNPLDTDAAFRLVFNGGVTHDSTGITGNNVNAFANTFLNDQTTLNIDNKHIAMYQRNILTNDSGGSMGIGNAHRFYLNFAGSNYSTLGMAQSAFAIVAPQRGVFVMSKTSDGQFKYFQNALTPITKTGTNSPQNSIYYLLASSLIPSAPGVSNANLSLASIGDGLSDTEVTNYRTAINTFQTTLSRNV